ncbi:MAG: cytidine deaminase [Clostridiales bacterium]|nr:cytidine deaminase [Clostridiales bacterium]
MDQKTYANLIRQAWEARKMAYAPYSGFLVGAALLTPDGSVYRGCNIENAAFSPTNCAERTAFFKALSEGKRHFSAIAVVGGMRECKEDEIDYVYPCGVCRQVMAEFCGEEFVIVAAISPEDYRVHSLKELLPEAFGFREGEAKP